MIYCIPTDTCHGLACHFSDEQGYHDIYSVKGRSFRKPLAFAIETFDEIGKYAELTDGQIEFLRAYPHPFTVLAPPLPGTLPVFLDSEMYRFVGLRIGERCLRPEVRRCMPFPLFLTSANLRSESVV